jgi:hypothetical protein
VPAAVLLALLLQAAPRGTPELRTGLDTLYGGHFDAAAHYFAGLAARDSTDPAPLIFQASAYMWWASALDSATFEQSRIDSLLGLAIERARAAGPPADFWFATAHGYRARERDLHGHAWGASRDAKAMRDAYKRVLVTDTTCADCYLGIGLYHYGLGRAGVLARLVARLIGLGSGNVEEGLRYLRRASREGDLAQVEASWVLAVALAREADRDPAGRAVLLHEARAYAERLAVRYPANPVFLRFLTEIP